jgi:hypothetical protein
MWHVFHPLLIALVMITAQGVTCGEALAQATAKQCPSVKAMCPTGDWTLDRPVFVTAQISDVAPDAVLTYNWTISAGTIKSGQGTPTITIDTSATAGQSVTATVEVGGINGCPMRASCSLPIIDYAPPEPRRLDQYSNLTLREERQRLDNLAAQLKAEPESKAYIIIYPGHGFGPTESEGRARRAREYLVKRLGIDAKRILFSSGNAREDLTFELYILPPNTLPSLYPILVLDKEPPSKSKLRSKARKLPSQRRH